MEKKVYFECIHLMQIVVETEFEEIYESREGPMISKIRKLADLYGIISEKEMEDLKVMTDQVNSCTFV